MIRLTKANQPVPRREFLRQLLALSASSALLASCGRFTPSAEEPEEAMLPILPNSSQTNAQKVRIVVSDTHMGAGRVADGNLLEDFSADSEWAALFAELTSESETNGTDMELIINGDWFDYLQVPAVDEFDPQEIYPTDVYLFRTQAAAVQQTALIYAGHRPVFDSLGNFLNASGPRRSITILFGNHDPELAFKDVQTQIRGFLGATGDKADLVNFGDRTYFEDGVYIEHGNAYLDSLNRFADPESPFDPLDPTLIEHPVGSLFVSYFYNEIERQRFWIDAVLPLTSVLFYGFAFDIPFAMQALQGLGQADPEFIDNVLTTLKAEGENEAVISTIERILRSEVSEIDIVKEVDRIPDLWRNVADTLVERGAIPAALAQQVANADISPSQLASLIREEANHDLEISADIVAQGIGAEVVCFGHIHENIQKRLPDSNAIYLNTGTWINAVDFSDASLTLWYDLVNNPESYADQRSLAYARIEHDAQGKLLSAGLFTV